MKEGEKYLSIKIIGHEFIKAFPNQKKEKEDQPDFTAPGIAIWVNKVKRKTETKTEDII